METIYATNDSHVKADAEGISTRGESAVQVVPRLWNRLDVIV